MKNAKTDIEGIIKKAVQEAYEAGRAQRGQEPKEVFRATERRLYAYPDILDRLRADHYGAKIHSKDILRSVRGGRVPDAVKEAALDIAAEAAKARDEAEIEEIEAALSVVQDDVYYPAVQMRYFENASDADIAKVIYCDERTVRRNRGRLVRRIAVRLFGADAL